MQSNFAKSNRSRPHLTCNGGSSAGVTPKKSPLLRVAAAPRDADFWSSARKHHSFPLPLSHPSSSDEGNDMDSGACSRRNLARLAGFLASDAAESVASSHCGVVTNVYPAGNSLSRPPFEVSSDFTPFLATASRPRRRLRRLLAVSLPHEKKLSTEPPHMVGRGSPTMTSPSPSAMKKAVAWNVPRRQIVWRLSERRSFRAATPGFTSDR